jgi:hypothetical protein
MINQKFDILNKPVLSCYNAAYLVDYKNVELHRQYVAKYYSSHDLHWFDATIKGPIFNDKRCKLLLYYNKRYIGVGDRNLLSTASRSRLTIYYITNVLMTVE